MKDMISQIVQMDKEAQQKVNDALARKTDMEHTLTEKRQHMRDELLSRAYERVEKSRPAEEKTAQEQMEALRARQTVLINNMNERDQELGDQWADEIASHVIEQLN